MPPPTANTPSQRQEMGKYDYERLIERYTTVASLYDDATCTWFVYLDPQRRTAEDCRWKGSGDTLDDAIQSALAMQAAKEV